MSKLSALFVVVQLMKNLLFIQCLCGNVVIPQFRGQIEQLSVFHKFVMCFSHSFVFGLDLANIFSLWIVFFQDNDKKHEQNTPSFGAD